MNGKLCKYSFYCRVDVRAVETGEKESPGLTRAAMAGQIE